MPLLLHKNASPANKLIKIQRKTKNQINLTRVIIVRLKFIIQYLVNKPAKSQAHKQMKKARVLVQIYPALSGSQMA